MRKSKVDYIKICFVASSGGHLEEIACLKEVEEKYESFLITEKGSFNEINFTKKKYYFKQINRKEIFFLFKFIKNFFINFFILLKEKPNFIISTGALVTIPTCLLGKLMRKKIIYIESFARIDNLSITGKIMYRISDVFIVQWNELLEYYPKAIYLGGIF